jgi:bifunctional UDP-N-acetylglucosamine pyrophosphorylase/glucosamine-1-phosphate N-acetyltransferase
VSRLSTDNAQGELYLTDLVALAAQAEGVLDLPRAAEELQGLNDRAELADRERVLRLRRAAELGREGVTVRDPHSAFIDADVVIEPDARIEANVQLRGRCHVGRGAHIDVGCVLQDVTVAAGAQLLPYTVASDSSIGEGARVGPFSHLRPASELGPGVHVGNFVETKKTRLARGAKANHLAYLGDGEIGQDANIGAGTIFCNYDGFLKHRTVIGERAFIGSDSQLVAPVSVGDDAYVGSGSTVTSDVPAGDLAIGRARQVNKPGMGLRMRERLRAQAERVKGRAKG